MSDTLMYHDYEHNSCGSVFEALVTAEQKRIKCPVCRKGMAHRIYRKFGGMLGKNKGLFPYFDKQLGVTLESSQHRDAVAKKRGLVTLGREEFDRSRHAPRTPDPFDSDKPDPEFIEMAKRTFDDVKFGRIAPETEEKRVADAAARAQADFLNTDAVKS